MDRNKLKLIMFDFDGTLVDSQGAISAAMGESFAGAGLARPTVAAVRRVVGLRLEEAIGKLAPEADEAVIADLAERYREAFFVLRTRPDHYEPLFPGARAALQSLGRPELMLGIATGKNRRGLLASLERHDIGGHFTMLMTADDGPGKPHPAILEQAMAELGVGPQDTVMIGDTVFDMQMARSARACAIGVSWGYHEPEELTRSGARCVIESFDELLPVLTELDFALP